MDNLVLVREDASCVLKVYMQHHNLLSQIV